MIPLRGGRGRRPGLGVGRQRRIRRARRGTRRRRSTWWLISAPADLAEVFQREPGNATHSNALVNALGAELLAIREAAELFVGAFTVEVTEVQPALWHEAAVFWFTDVHNRPR